MSKGCLIYTSLFMLCSTAQAADPFVIDATISNGGASQQVMRSFNKVQAVANFFETNSLAGFVPSYSDNSGVAASIRYMGVPVQMSYAENSTTLTFSVPGMGLSQNFTGATRDDSTKQFRDWVKGNGSSLIKNFQKYLIANSTLSSVAGNPGSLQAAMVNSSFASAALDTQNNAANLPRGGRFGVNVSGGQFSVQNYSGTQWTLPLSYSYGFDTPGWQLQFNMPLGYQEVEGAKSYSAQMGLGLQIPVISGVDWYLTPSLSAGVTGSADLGVGGALYSFTLSSRYTYHVNSDVSVTMGNMIGRINSAEISVGDYSINPGVDNTITKNGLEVEYKTHWNWLGSPVSMRGGAAYSHASGSRLAIPHYVDVFFDFGTITSSTAAFYKRLRLGATYTTGEDYRSGSLTLGYKF